MWEFDFMEVSYICKSFTCENDFFVVLIPIYIYKITFYVSNSFYYYSESLLFSFHH